MTMSEQQPDHIEHITQPVSPTNEDIAAADAYIYMTAFKNIRGVPDNFAELGQAVLDRRNALPAPYDQIFQPLPENAQLSEEELLTQYDGTILDGRQAVQVNSMYGTRDISIGRVDVMTRQQLPHIVVRTTPDSLTNMSFQVLNVEQGVNEQGNYSTTEVDQATQEQLQRITSQYLLDRAAYSATPIPESPVYPKTRLTPLRQWRAETFMHDRLQNTADRRAAAADNVKQVLTPPAQQIKG